jgi:hypothetical protein
MKSKYTLFRRGEMSYMQDSATGRQTSLRTKDETEAKSLLNARNEAQRQPACSAVRRAGRWPNSDVNRCCSSFMPGKSHSAQKTNKLGLTTTRNL